MKIQKDETYITITPNGSDFKVFYKQLTSKIDDYKENNIILNFLNYEIKIDEIIQFKNISEEKVGLGTSFVVIKENINIDEIPDELIVVPTFQEAIDMIEFDEMTRSLDF